jgi:hypothetical protein
MALCENSLMMSQCRLKSGLTSPPPIKDILRKEKHLDHRGVKTNNCIVLCPETHLLELVPIFVDPTHTVWSIVSLWSSFKVSQS